MCVANRWPSNSQTNLLLSGGKHFQLFVNVLCFAALCYIVSLSLLKIESFAVFMLIITQSQGECYIKHHGIKLCLNSDEANRKEPQNSLQLSL